MRRGAPAARPDTHPAAPAQSAPQPLRTRASLPGLLSARAYSFRVKSRLAISLGWIGGFVNVTTLLACGTMTSHVTGNATLALLRNVEGQRDLAGYAAFAVGAFFCGAVVSALLTEHARRAGWRSKYVVPIVIEALLLLWVAAELRRTGAAHVNHDRDWWALVGVAAAAMGIQNATITRISGSVVRTTHLTGVVTDLGIESVQLAHWWRDRARSFGARPSATRGARLLRISRREPSLLRLLLLLSIGGSFLFGAFIGAEAFRWNPSAAMTLPVAFLAWIVWIDLRTPIADVRELDALDDPSLNAAGIVRELLPKGIAIYRLHHAGRHGAHRAPDFHLWTERLAAGKRVLVLSLSPATDIDEDAALDLKSGIEFLGSTGRRLVIGGLSRAQYHALERHGVLEALAADDVCPDLEFALARAVSLVDPDRG